MKIQVISDIHVEFQKKANVEIYKNFDYESDVLLIAGDVDIDVEAVTQVLTDIRERFAGKILFCLGNHEYYASSFTRVNKEFATVKEQLAELGIFILNPGYIKIDEVHFIGACGWTDDSYVKYNPIEESMIRDNDLREADNTQVWGRDDIEYIKNRLFEIRQQDEPSVKIVVLTHHAPYTDSMKKRFKNSKYKHFFENDWSTIIKEFEPILWVHGHMHDSLDYQFHNTRVICNPYGYYRYNINHGFLDKLILEI